VAPANLVSGARARQYPVQTQGHSHFRCRRVRKPERWRMLPTLRV